jgi:hypothetical protein
MDVKQKQQAVVEFLLLEGCEGDGILLRVQNAYGRDASRRVSASRWMTEIRRGNEEFRNEGRPGGPIITDRMLLFAQFCEMIRMSHCEP